MFGSRWRVKLPFALLSAFTTLGCRVLTAWKLMHILLLGASPGADFLGTTMIGLAHGETLLVMIPSSLQAFDLLLYPVIVFEG